MLPLALGAAAWLTTATALALLIGHAIRLGDQALADTGDGHRAPNFDLDGQVAA